MRQLPLLGEVSSLLAKGNVARSNGDNLAACSFYENAAKIEIYKQNKASARNFLVLAEEVSEKEQQHHAFYETMLADMDQVLGISKAFQSFAPDRTR